MSAEEESALDLLGQSNDEGRSIPAPEMVLFTGETALKVQELADICGISSQEVIGLALQDLYNKVKAREKAEREGVVAEVEKAQKAQEPPQEAESGDPWRPY